MTTTIQYRPKQAGQVRRDAVSHLYAVGQTVRLTGGFRTLATKTADIYQITAKLPPRGDSLQYRIRNDEERYERVTTQESLEPVDMSVAGGATLMERTFGHGKGTETQQS